MFHNMTPPELADEPSRGELKASAAQLAHALSLGTHIWTYSEENRRFLVDAGVDMDRIRFVPFPIEPPRPIQDRRQPSPIRLLTIGRISRPKGADVLVDAIGKLVATTSTPIRVELVGNLEWSDQEFLRQLRDQIRDLGLDGVITLATDVDDEALWHRLERAHILVNPSLHEGLSVPIVEAYLAGCRVVASDGGNLRFLVQPPDPVVPAGDATALAQALLVTVDQVTAGLRHDPDVVGAACALYSAESAGHHLYQSLAALDDPTRPPLPWPPQLAFRDPVRDVN
jgi:glycosyltransferase involved in cell wall biosynthesis